MCDESIAIDAFNFGCMYEKYLAEKLLNRTSDASLEKLFHLMRFAENNFLELALQYAHAGMFDDAITLLSSFKSGNKNTSPLLHYYLGWLYKTSGNEEDAVMYFQQAAEDDTTIVFPNKIEEIIILQSAIALNKTNAKACYYLGNLWYDKRQYDEAIDCWERSIQLNKNFATPYRNLAIAYYNKRNDKEKSLRFLEKAFALDDNDARVLMELDQLYKINGKSFKERLALLEKYPQLLEQRDDLYIERITLYQQCKRL